jgi:hypothetical protein
MFKGLKVIFQEMVTKKIDYTTNYEKIFKKFIDKP